MPASLTVIVERPAVPGMRLLDVHGEEVGRPAEPSGQLTVAGEFRHERRSAATAEVDDQGSSAVRRTMGGQGRLDSVHAEEGRVAYRTPGHGRTVQVKEQ